MAKISVKHFLELNEQKNNLLKVRQINTGGIDNKLSTYDVNRPGMALFGYFEYFAFDRIQLFGKGEGNYLRKLNEEGKFSVFDDIFAYKLPICIFSNNIDPPDSFVEKATECNVPILVSELDTSKIVRFLVGLLENEFASSTSLHGVFIEVFGVGIFIKGKSGIGKSEATLELIERGHRLIADDSVEFKRLHDDLVIGRCNKTLKHNMEIRGIGIVDIARLSGMSAIRDRKKLELVILLEDWVDGKKYDRTGLDDYFETILGVPIRYLCIPVRPGRNVYILIEAAAKNHRLKEMGYHSARELNKRMIEIMQNGEM